MTTPFDDAILAIAEARYHNHRLETHSDVVCDGLVRDLTLQCDAFRSDLSAGTIRVWKNVSSPGRLGPVSPRRSQPTH